jgi:Flp pilus assembly protein TadG
MGRSPKVTNKEPRMKYSPGRRSERRGAAMVEFAMVAPLFFLLVFGVIEFGRAFMVQQILTDAARVGCRKAIVGTSNTTVTSAVTTELQKTGIATSNASVTMTVGGSSSGSASGAVSGTEITVLVTVPVKDVSWLGKGIFLQNSLSGQFTMRKE